jgi:hypothetical protein
MAKLDHEIAFGDATVRDIERDPVVRQPRSAEHEMAGLERPDPVADEGLPGGRGDEVQLVLVVEVPARERRREAVGEAAHESGIGGRLVAERRRARVFVLQLGLALARQAPVSRGGHRVSVLSMRSAPVSS